MNKIFAILFIFFNSISAYAGHFEDAENALNNKNYSTALEKYKNAAELGNSMAYIKLGNMYDAGLGIPQDTSQAFKYYKDAARLGHVLGYVFVSAMYENGQGVAKDLTEAVRWKNMAKLCASINPKNCENLDR